MALKRKQIYQDQINKIMGSRMTLETQAMAIENANVNLETINAMKQAADAMKQIHGNLLFIVNLRNVDKVDTTMDDIREQMDLANEISDAISQPVQGFGLQFDDEELNNELDLLEQAELDSKLLSVGDDSEGLMDMPNIPSINIPGILLLL